MKKVCLFNYPTIGEFHGYHISTMDPTPYSENAIVIRANTIPPVNSANA